MRASQSQRKKRQNGGFEEHRGSRDEQEAGWVRGEKVSCLLSTIDTRGFIAGHALGTSRLATNRGLRSNTLAKACRCATRVWKRQERAAAMRCRLDCSTDACEAIRRDLKRDETNEPGRSFTHREVCCSRSHRNESLRCICGCVSILSGQNAEC